MKAEARRVGNLRRLCGRSAVGFALMELLVALSVCSVGLLGLGVVALRQTASWRSIEHEQRAQDHLMRMAQDLQVSMATVQPSSFGGWPPELQSRLQHWQADVARSLPEGRGAVLWSVRRSDAGRLESVPVEVSWMEAGRAGKVHESRVLRVLVIP